MGDERRRVLKARQVKGGPGKGRIAPAAPPTLAGLRDSLVADVFSRVLTRQAKLDEDAPKLLYAAALTFAQVALGGAEDGAGGMGAAATASPSAPAPRPDQPPPQPPTKPPRPDIIDVEYTVLGPPEPL
jgi:hypothetical protein